MRKEEAEKVQEKSKEDQKLSAIERLRRSDAGILEIIRNIAKEEINSTMNRKIMRNEIKSATEHGEIIRDVSKEVANEEITKYHDGTKQND